jgi:hypothetical protein
LFGRYRLSGSVFDQIALQILAVTTAQWRWHADCRSAVASNTLRNPHAPRPAPCRLLLALSLSHAAHAAEKVLNAGESADTGSRSVRVPSGVAAGAIDTGSGDALLEAGAVARNIDTGSGNVELGTGASAKRIDTGSGDVRLSADAQCADIDTGSGDVRLADGARTESIDTGSGNLRGGRNLVIDGLIDTGSGAVELGSGSVVSAGIDYRQWRANPGRRQGRRQDRYRQR